MLAPDSIQVLVPALVTVPVVVPMMLASVPPMVPPKVSPKVGPVIVPVLERVMAPELDTILAALPNVIKPLKVTGVATLLVSAPAAAIPVPFRVSGSAVPRVKPFKSRTAPVVTEVAPPTVPSGVLVLPPFAPNFRVPALTVVNPLKVLSPARIRIPVPLFVIPPVPLIIPA